MLLIGSHISLSGKEMFLGSVKETLLNGANCLMVYTGAPQNTKRANMNTFKIQEAHALLKENNIKLEHIIVHAPYILNLANPDIEKRKFAIDFLTQEVLRTNALGASIIVLHPGSAVGKDRPQATQFIAEGINQVLANTKGLGVKIALETMAGKGNEMGKTFLELAQIIQLIEDQSRIGVCFDTCHVFDAGYDLVNQKDAVLDEFIKTIGLDKLLVLHINDSKNTLGSMKDRHANIGSGYIGMDALMAIIYDQRLALIPKILETPYIDGKPPYKEEIALIKRNAPKNY